MKVDDALAVPSACSSRNGREDDKVDDSGCDACIEDPESIELEETKANGAVPQSLGDITDGDNRHFEATDNGNYMVENSLLMEVGLKLDETDVMMKEKTCFSNIIHAENGCIARDESRPNYHKDDEVLVSCWETSASSLSGTKRPWETIDEQEPSVQVIFKSLTRDSRKKLEELLQQWSQWHAKHCSSAIDSGKVLESGEEIYFPALQVGVDKASTVSFWLDNETRNEGNKDFISFDGKSVPLYDRGYSLALTSADRSSNPEGVMEIREASRCFNCGSFSHSLKDCPQPRDHVAVNNARKQHKSKRNQNAGSLNPCRYYQESVGGKYDGLRPGSLDAETRQLLGLGEFDPPPWLNRMREIGYPPGYLDEEDEDQPSGITIFGDEEIMEEKEEGEISDNSRPVLPKKMTVEFPGVNAPIPESADESRWAAGASDLCRSYGRYNRSSDTTSRGYYHEERWSSDTRDGEPPPPGCEPESPCISSYSRRYGGYDSNSHRDNPSTPWSSNYGRSMSDRSRRNRLRYDDSPNHRSYGHLSSSSPR